jgi:cytochrome c peroxidase
MRRRVAILFRQLLGILLVLFCVSIGLRGGSRLSPAEETCAASASASNTASRGMSRVEVYARTKALTELGRRMFGDPSLSRSGRISCASCHSPSHFFGPPNESPAQAGGNDLKQMGVRAAPSLKYLQAVPQFTEHFVDADDSSGGADNGPTGGLNWDGRVDRGRDQARIPLLSPYEMANPTPEAVVAKAEKSYSAELLEIFGEPLFCNPNAMFDAILEAFEVYEQDYQDFYPYSSKYDAYLAGKATLTAAELRGLALFDNPAKGNCAKCHISQRGKDGTPPQFTDYGFAALGVPRNKMIAANRDPAYHDLGLCGPLRTDLRNRAEYCGLFMTPTLRNVATRKTFFHNGAFHRLKEVLEFYSERDSNPGKWYSRNQDESINKFDDLPAQYRINVNFDPPFSPELESAPSLSGDEIEDIMVFLQTLTDGYEVSNSPSAYVAPSSLRK